MSKPQRNTEARKQMLADRRQWQRTRKPTVRRYRPSKNDSPVYRKQAA